jgi:hypothetical protein
MSLLLDDIATVALDEFLRARPILFVQVPFSSGVVPTTLHATHLPEILDDRHVGVHEPIDTIAHARLFISIECAL